MSGEKALFQALYARLTLDQTLVDLVTGGVWAGRLPDRNNVRRFSWNGSAGVYGATLVAAPTWVEYLVASGGQLNDATGPLWNDLEVRIDAKSADSLLAAVNVEARVDQLLTGWTPTLTGYPGVWAVDKVNEGRDRAPPVWIAYGVYRLRYGDG